MGNCLTLNCFSEPRQQPLLTPAPVSVSSGSSGAAPVSVSSGSGSAPTVEEVINSLKAVSDPTNLKELVGIIKQLLEEKKSNRGSTSESAKEKKGMFALFVKSGANFLKFVNEHTEKIEDEKEGKSRVVAEILGIIGELHWVVGGLSIAAYLIEKCEKVSANKAEALELLTNMVDLATTIFKLRDVIPEEKDRLKNAVMLLVEGSIMCVSQIYSEYIFSFLKTTVNSENLKEMSKTIHHLYKDLNLAITTAIAKRQPILHPMPKPFYPKGAVGIEKAQQEVIKMLNIKPQDESSLAVVIYGFGGIGKTTLAISILAMLDLNGYNFAWVNLDEDSSKSDLQKKQEQILSDAFPNYLSGARIELRDCQEGQLRLKAAFSCSENKPVFLFIDNALRSDDLKKLLPDDLGDLPKRSRILLTTRRLDATDVIKGLTRHSFAMKTLDRDHALEILCNDPDKLERIKDDRERILRICGGVPLALTIVRGHLVKMGYDAGKCRQILRALEEGGNVKEENLSERLVNFVYNELENGTKDAFLDICCFFNGWIRRHVEYIVGAQEVKSLEEAAMVSSIVDDHKERFGNATPFVTYEDMWQIYAGEERLIVHDIVRAKGRTMSEFTRFMDAESFYVTAQDEKIQQTNGIWLSDDDHGLHYDELILEAKQVELMSRSLRVLSLGDSTRLNGRCQRAFVELRFFHISYREDLLPIQLSKSRQLAFFSAQFRKEQRISEQKYTINLPDSLQVLYLEGPRDSPVSLNINGRLASLRELHLSYITFENFETSIKIGNLYCLKILKLNYVERLPESLGNLSLQTLRMDSCSNLKRFPESFGNLSSLQTLNMDSCSNLERLPESFGNLSSLQTLRMDSCSNLERLPDSFGNLSSLQTLRMDSCSNLKRLPESFGNLSSLQTLDMDSCSNLERLPESFGNLSSLQTLRMYSCSNLERLPESFGDLSSLQTLGMDSCSNLERLPERLRNLSSLQTLLMDGCSNLKRLSESLGNLSSLQTLLMDGCSNLEKLPESFGNLSSLQTLRMYSCSNLKRLPESFGNLSSLQTLRMDSCSNLEGLSESFGNLSSLQTLDMDSCSNLKRLPENFGNLSSLQTLRMYRCSNLERLPESFGNLSSLQTLLMDSCSNLEKLPESFGNLSSMQTLCMDCCSNLERLPDSFGNLSSLQTLRLDNYKDSPDSPETLRVNNCSKLKKLPESFGNLSSLQTLRVDSCSNLDRLPESFGNLTSLQILRVDSCSNLERLPESFGNLSSLQTFRMDSCSNMERLPESFGNLSSLQTFRMDSCSNLERLPESFGNLSSLQTLGMDSCSNLKRLPESVGNLSSLQTLRVDSCSDLKRLPESFGNLSSMQTLRMDSCSNLERLPESFGNLSSLQTLRLDSCSNLERLPESFGNLSSLQTLRMDNCSNLERLPQSFGNLSSLQTLFLDGCVKMGSLSDKFGQLQCLKFLRLSNCKQLKSLPDDIVCLTSLAAVRAYGCAELEANAMDSLVEINSLMFLEMGESPMLIKRWGEIQQHHPLIGAALRFERDNYPYGEIMSPMFFNGGSRFLHVDGEGQLAEVASSSFPDVGVKVGLLTTCVFSDELRQKLQEVASSGVQIIYVDVGVDVDVEGSNWMEEREKRIRETLVQLPKGSRAWTCPFHKTRLLLAYSIWHFTSSRRSYGWELVGTSVVVDEEGRRKLSHSLEMIFRRKRRNGLDCRRVDFQTLFSPLSEAWKFMRKPL